MEIEVEEIMDEEEYLVPFEASDIYRTTVERMHEFMVKGRIQLQEHDRPSYFLLDVKYNENFRRLKTCIYQIIFNREEETLYEVVTGSSRCLPIFSMDRTNVALLRNDTSDGYMSVTQLARTTVSVGRNILIPKGAKIVLHTEALSTDFDTVKEISDDTQVWLEDLISNESGTRRICFIGIDKEENERKL